MSVNLKKTTMKYKHQNWRIGATTQCDVFGEGKLESFYTLHNPDRVMVEVRVPPGGTRIFSSDGRMVPDARPTLFIEEEVEPQIGDEVYCTLVNMHGKIVDHIIGSANPYPVKVRFSDGRVFTYSTKGICGIGLTETMYITKRAPVVITELTVAEIAKKLGLDPSSLRIKD